MSTKQIRAEAMAALDGYTVWADMGSLKRDEYRKRAEQSCDQCGQPNPGWMLGAVCGKCCRKNHRRALGRVA